MEYVVCINCCSLYDVNSCIIDSHGKKESKYCSFVEFPNHPHISRRNSCGAVLMKKIKIKDSFKLVPKKIYVYHSIILSLEEMVKRPGFLGKCEFWRTREKMENFMGDIYDGKLWEDLQMIGERPFLSQPNNLCLALNIDWFNPYKETQYSVGGIYLTILNLPRNELYQEENVLLVGMIPGPKEPGQHINNFLSPLVKDMQVQVYLE